MPEALASLRCAFCHDDLGARAVTCTRCGTKLHPDCGRELALCPSLGCGDWTPLQTWTDALRDAPGWLASWMLFGVVAGLGVLAVGVVLMAMVVHIHSTFSF